MPDGVVDLELGRGGMGRVLRLKDPLLDREVAVKELLPQHQTDATMEALFYREAQVLARLEHPGVVPVYELGRRPDGVLFYAMRRIRGESLESVLKTCVTLEERLALLSHYLQVVQTVGFAHSRHVVHRDLKAENVMVSRFGETQVIDWGLAVVDGVVGEAGVTAGTPSAMAPEQASGKGVDERSDVFSLGVLLYRLLAGKPPFTGATVSDLLNAVQYLEAPPIRELEPFAPSELVEVAGRALQKEPSARYADAGEMGDAVEAAMRARTPPSRALAWTSLVLGLSLVAALALTGWLVKRGNEAMRQAAVAVSESERSRAELAGQAALQALRAKDGRAAIGLSHRAIEEPLARGVALLAMETGIPSRAWTVGTEAGCSSLAVVDALVACGTLGGVSLFALSDGHAEGRLDTGPMGWQHAVAALPSHQLATGGDDRQLRVFDVTTRAQLGERVAFDDGITALASDGAQLWLGLRNGQVRAIEGPPLHQASKPVRALIASHGVVASSAGETLMVSRPEGLSSLDRHAGALAFQGDGLLVGVEHSVVSVNAQGTGISWGSHRSDVTALTVSDDGRAVSGSADGELRWWSAAGELEGAASVFEDPVRVLGPFPDGVLVVVRNALEAWRLPRALRPIWEERPTALSMLQGGRQVVAGFGDGKVRRAGVSGGPVEALELRHRGAVRALMEVPGEEQPARLRLLSGGEDGRVLAQRWNGEVETLAEEAAPVRAIAVSADGKRAAWVTEDGARVLHSLEFGKEVSRSRGARGRSVGFATNGARWAVGSEDKRVTVFDSQTGEELATSEPFDAAVTALTWTSAETFVVGCADGVVAEWSASERRVTRSWRGGHGQVTALSTAGNNLAAGGADGQLWLWALSGPAPLVRIPADAGEVKVVSLTQGRLVFAGTDRLIHALQTP